MNPKKETEKRAKNAGISLEPEIKKRATALAKEQGLKSLSALAHKLLSDALAEAAKAAEQAGQEKKESGLRKIRRAGEKAS